MKNMLRRKWALIFSIFIHIFAAVAEAQLEKPTRLVDLFIQ